MKKVTLWVGLLTLFLSGMAIGGLGVWVVSERKAMDPVTRSRYNAPEIIVGRLTRELNLDESQQKKITEIVREAHEELKVLRQRIRPEMDEIVQKSRKRMMTELSPPQQKKLEAFFERLEEKRVRRYHENHGRDRPNAPCR